MTSLAAWLNLTPEAFRLHPNCGLGESNWQSRFEIDFALPPARNTSNHRQVAPSPRSDVEPSMCAYCYAVGIMKLGLPSEGGIAR